jgi:hypothetical protein
MSSLIEELKKEHTDILDILDQVTTLGISSGPGRGKLLSARDLLIAHVTKEDERYYPGLRRAAEDNKNLKMMLRTFRVTEPLGSGLSCCIKTLFFAKIALCRAPSA